MRPPHRSPRAPLHSQSAPFWLGAFMVAEAIWALVWSLLPDPVADGLAATWTATPSGWLGVAAVSAVSAGVVAWVGHRCGWGD